MGFNIVGCHTYSSFALIQYPLSSDSSAILYVAKAPDPTLRFVNLAFLRPFSFIQFAYGQHQTFALQHDYSSFLHNQWHQVSRRQDNFSGHFDKIILNYLLSDIIDAILATSVIDGS